MGRNAGRIRRGSRLAQALEEAWELIKDEAAAGTLTGELAVFNGLDRHHLFDLLPRRDS